MFKEKCICCPLNVNSSGQPQCGDIGNIFIDYTSNGAEFNFFMDPFAAY